MASDKRTYEQLREQYQIEKELALKLRNATKEQRKYLYSEVYDIFFKSIPHLPQLLESETERRKKVKYLLRELNPLLTHETTYLEVGAGDCKVALEVAGNVKKVFVIEASDELVKNIVTPDNFELIVGDSTEISMPDNSIDVVFSNQVMEHLHPDDAMEQLQHIYRILRPGGKYFCMTPNRLSGPHDISKHFDDIPSGFHLKEYTSSELYNLFLKVGFTNLRSYARFKKKRIFIPFFLNKTFEKILEISPGKMRRAITRNVIILKLLGINFIGIK